MTTPLVSAAKAGNLQEVTRLLDSGVDVNQKDPYGQTALIEASKYGHLAVAALLLDRGASIDLQNLFGWTALHYASHWGKANVVSLLLERGANPSIKDNQGKSALDIAREKKNSDCVGMLENYEPIFMGCINGNLEMVASNLEKIEQVNKDRNSPLSLACIHGHIEVVNLLLDRQANIEHVNKDQNSPLSLACLHGHIEIVNLLLDRQAKIDHKNNAGNFPLLLACEKGHLGIVHLLLDRGANMTQVNYYSRKSSLEIACEQGHTEIVELLLDRQQNEFFSKRVTFELMSSICKRGHIGIAILFLERCASSLRQKDTGYSCYLIEACEHGQIEIVKLLLDQQANVDHQNSRCDTPMILACEKGHLEVVQLLIDRQANINHQNLAGDTALHIACVSGHKSIISLLLERGCDINLKNKEGTTALQALRTSTKLAKQKKDECLKLFEEVIKNQPPLPRPSLDPKYLSKNKKMPTNENSKEENTENTSEQFIASPPPAPAPPPPSIETLVGEDSSEGMLKMKQHVEKLERLLTEKDLKISTLSEEKLRMEMHLNEQKTLNFELKKNLKELREAKQYLEHELIQKDNELKKIILELKKFHWKQGIGLKEPHVRIESTKLKDRNDSLVDGIFRSRGQDYPCKLKMATNPSQQSQLEREREIMEVIRLNDTLHQHSEFIVTWLYPGQYLTHESDNLFYFNENGEKSPLPLSSPMKSLVFESGKMNLKDFMTKHRPSVRVIQRVQILGEIARALNFLHGLGIVHFDLKPENVVCFPSPSGSSVRWKLIDFDSSYDVSHTSHVIRSTNCQNIRVTEEYVCPEIMRILNCNPNNLATPPVLPVDVEVSWKIDIWSLGMVGIFLFSNYSLWEMIHGNTPFHNTMVSKVTQHQIQHSFSDSFLGDKEKSFLESCLQIDDSKRLPSEVLLQKSLFDTGLATVHSKSFQGNNETIRIKFMELQEMMQRFQVASRTAINEDLEIKLGDFYSCLCSELERNH